MRFFTQTVPRGE